MKASRGESSNDPQDNEDEPYDPHAQLYHIDERYKIKKRAMEEGSVTSSVAMLTAIPEVDLGIEFVSPSVSFRFAPRLKALILFRSTRLRNIEDTEKAKRTVEEEKKARRNEHDAADAQLAATRCEWTDHTPESYAPD